MSSVHKLKINIINIENNIYYKNNSKYFFELKTIVENNPNSYHILLTHKYAYLNNWINSIIKNEYKISFSTKIYWVFNNYISYPLCDVCNKPITRNAHSINGYGQHGCTRKHCSYTCTKNDPERALKTKKTCLKKYGVEAITQTKHFKEQSKKTKKEKYSDENYNNREKCAETNLKILGVKFPGQSLNCRKKAKETCLRLYGDENYNNMQKTKLTKLLRYGDANYNNQKNIKKLCF